MQLTYTLMGMLSNVPDLFENFSLPENLDSQTCLDCILEKCGTNEVRYPYPLYMKTSIGKWCARHATQFQKMYETTILSYNPIHNYNMTDEITEQNSGNDQMSGTNTGTVSNKETGTETDKESGTDTTIRSGSEQEIGTDNLAMTRAIAWTDTTTGSKGTATQEGQIKTRETVTSKVSGQSTVNVTHNISAYNASALQKHSEDITTQSDYPTMKEVVTETPGTGKNTVTESYDGYSVKTSPGTGTDNDNRSLNSTKTYNNVQDKRTPDITRTRTPNLSNTRTDDLHNSSTTTYGKKTVTTEKKQGNIGVTTTQQMIEAERQVLLFNIYEWIASMFEDYFTVCIY